MENSILVTGDLGFVGRHALEQWPDSIGLAQNCPEIDIRDKSALCRCISQVKPQFVVHLAGVSFVPDAFRDPRGTLEINFMATLNLLEALAESDFLGRFLFVSSGDAYGLVPENLLPIQETLSLRPRNPYAASKAAAEALCYQWSQTGPFEVMVARPFNHIGPRQAPNFAVSDFAKQIAEIKSGNKPPALSVGNIDVTRDFTDVRDVLSAYRAILKHGQNGETYNVCSGTERSLRELIEQLLEIADVTASIEHDPIRNRPSDQPRVRGSFEKLRAHTGWHPTIPLSETLTNLYFYWENEIGK